MTETQKLGDDLNNLFGNTRGDTQVSVKDVLKGHREKQLKRAFSATIDSKDVNSDLFRSIISMGGWYLGILGHIFSRKNLPTGGGDNIFSSIDWLFSRDSANTEIVRSLGDYASRHNVRRVDKIVENPRAMSFATDCVYGSRADYEREVFEHLKRLKEFSDNCSIENIESRLLDLKTEVVAKVPEKVTLLLDMASNMLNTNKIKTLIPEGMTKKIGLEQETFNQFNTRFLANYGNIRAEESNWMYSQR